MPKPLNGSLYNALHSRSPRKVRKFLKRMIAEHNLDFVVLSEFADYFGYLRKRPIKGFTILGENERGKNQNVILVRETVQVQNVRALQMTSKGWYTTSGHLHVPVFSTAALLDGWLRVLSVHAPVSVDWPNGRPVGPTMRVQAYIDHSERCVRFAQYDKRGRKTLLAGDWNCRPHVDKGFATTRWIADQTNMQIETPLVGPGHDRIDYTISNADVRRFRHSGKTGGSDHGLFLFTVRP